MDLRRTLQSEIRSGARRGGDLVLIRRDEEQRIPRTHLHRQAGRIVSELRSRGVVPGAHVAVLGSTTEEVVVAITAVWQMGCVLVPLPLPGRGANLESFAAATCQRLQKADVRLLLLDPEVGELGQVFARQTEVMPIDLSHADLVAGDVDQVALTADQTDLALIQFTSGTTSEPKGVALSHQQLLANICGATGRLSVSADDVFVSWLPLFHDMGLVGMLLTSLILGSTLVLGRPQDFIARPRRWMQWVSAYSGSVTAAPNFAYGLAAKAFAGESGLDLSSLRVCVNGAEPIDADTVRAFTDGAARFQLDPESIVPAYGMAELGIAGLFSKGLHTEWVDVDRLERAGEASLSVNRDRTARELVIVGQPIDGLEARIVSPGTTTPCIDRQVGELQLSGSSVMCGFYNDPRSTDLALSDGWLSTGDLAYATDGSIVLCGRLKDMMIIAGRNIYPQDVEAVVGSVPGVRAGCAAAVSANSTGDQMTILVELDGVPSVVIRDVELAVVREIGVRPQHVVSVPVGALQKTSSGKLQRAKARDAWLNTVNSDGNQPA